MQKKFTKYLSFSLIAALVLIIVVIFGIQTFSAQKIKTKDGKEKLKNIEERLKSNDEQIEDLKGDFGQNALAKARAFSYIISQKPSVLNDTVTLQKIADLLMVEEVNVMDENGILRWGNVPDYFGLDFSKDEQTKPFMEILTDPSKELVQDAQENAAKGKLVQYIGISRIDKKGIVQIGVAPEQLEKMLKNNTIDNVLKKETFGTTGYAFALDKKSGKVLAHKNEALIGKKCEETGLPQNVLSKSQASGFAKIDGQKVFYVTGEHNSMILGVAMPESELYENRTSEVILFVGISCAIFIALIIFINGLLKKQVISGILHIIGDLEKITGGDLDTHVEVRNNKEFIKLSDSINTMVSSIKESIHSAAKKAEENEKLMKEQEKLFEEIKTASVSVSEFSQKTLSVSQQISEGTLEQAGSVEHVLNNMEQLNKKSKESSEISRSVSNDSKNAVSQMTEANENMKQLLVAMSEIRDAAGQIENIIGQIDEIASSTNMLSLNASIEAARAGENGKGFAVVADQVGALAGESAKAAKETGILIQNVLSSIQKGGQMAEKAENAFLQVVDVTKKSGETIGGLADISKEQAEMVSTAAESIQHISAIAEHTSAVSAESKEASEELAVQAGKLLNLVK